MKIRKCQRCDRNLICIPFKTDDEPDGSKRYRCIWKCWNCGHSEYNGFISASGLKMADDLFEAAKEKTEDLE